MRSHPEELRCAGVKELRSFRAGPPPGESIARASDLFSRWPISASSEASCSTQAICMHSRARTEGSGPGRVRACSRTTAVRTRQVPQDGPTLARAPVPVRARFAGPFGARTAPGTRCFQWARSPPVTTASTYPPGAQPLPCPCVSRAGESWWTTTRPTASARTPGTGHRSTPRRTTSSSPATSSSFSLPALPSPRPGSTTTTALGTPGSTSRARAPGRSRR